MATVWFTADLHLGHANILKYCQRPFLSKDEREKASIDPRGDWEVSRDSLRRHDEALLAAINESVRSDDELWNLGDFCWGEHDEAKKYIQRIACRNIFFVWGNHDHRSIEAAFQKTMEQGMISVKGQSIWLNHYPMRSWDRRFHGSWSLYGHVHNRLTAFDRANPEYLTKDVGVDACDYRPISFEQLQSYMKPRVKAFEEMKTRIMEGKAKGESLD